MTYPLGAHLVTLRPGYTHHGIYVGHGTGVQQEIFGGSLPIPHRPSIEK